MPPVGCIIIGRLHRLMICSLRPDTQTIIPDPTRHEDARGTRRALSAHMSAQGINPARRRIHGLNMTLMSTFIRTRWWRYRGDRHCSCGRPGQPWPPQVSAILATLHVKNIGMPLDTSSSKSRRASAWVVFHIVAGSSAYR